jgi:predicted metal-binding membrane protein
MMTPSAAPMILIYAGVGRQASAQGKPFATTGWFVAGYLLTWTAFALVATAAQFVLEQAALLDQTTASASRVFGGIVLIAAGVYEWTPLKDACLTQCRSPLMFIQQHGGFRRDPLGAVLLGLRHGAYCVGCCWMLMALLFVGGVMNVLWIAAISALVLVEKTLPAGRLFARTAGVALIATGVWLTTA